MVSRRPPSPTPGDTTTSLWLDAHDPSRIPTSHLPAGVSYDVAVAGGGLAGLATAVALARTGDRVLLLEACTFGAAATGSTEAKLTLLRGTRLSGRRTYAPDVRQSSCTRRANRSVHDRRPGRVPIASPSATAAVR